MNDQNKNLILATVLSFLVIMAWTVLFPPEEPPIDLTNEVAVGISDPTVPGTQDAAVAPTAPVDAELDAPAPRVAIKTDDLEGSFSLRGARIDTLSLTQYREENIEDSPIVQLLRPEGEAGAYYAAFGWAASDGVSAENVPTPDTVWTLESGDTLTTDTPVTLMWNNGVGQIFRTEISVDDEFMFSFNQSVTNNGDSAISTRPYGIIRRHGIPEDMKNFFILHEGLISMTDGELAETDYDDIQEYDIHPSERVPAQRLEAEESGWIGFTDHYWMTTLIPEQAAPFRSTSKYFESRDLFQAEAVMPVATIAAGETFANTTRFFAGAKEWETIKHYEEEEGVGGFLDSIDWGMFFFLTKPIFWLLHLLHGLIGNMGWAIIALTITLKALVLPLAYKSYVSMARMKELQPEMEKLKEQTGDDKQAMQQGMMKLYKDNKVSPASGCLPMILQIPIFFSLYKVIFVTIELRHAPWVGWITDLSSPDPSSIFNLFGLLPFAAPDLGPLQLLSLGILPIFLGVSMWLQQKLNPAPADPTQQMIFAWMPWVFMFMLGNFASGLVLYWIANNMITFTQQYLIMRSHGAKPDVFGNIKASLIRKKKADADTSEGE
ncbi:membrane protein insertase YidC [Loktanella sp. D2R18]|uniref:membrane protein insertase YidC n=1 Tax=Rhodobacterales TaxID=204455 RepID=UPI000DE9F306|nr:MULTISPECIES: membrane protein insertase YidC [Rhodobacterales]MDO6589913.1 membrane protein insertase YidC [Yoonia sp. 1_MG-2023]RBW45938.1 membrane protein insertase YidC [Loktanella sp. D2R18]